MAHKSSEETRRWIVGVWRDRILFYARFSLFLFLAFLFPFTRPPSFFLRRESLSLLRAYPVHLVSRESKGVPSKRKVVSHLWNGWLLCLCFTRAHSPLLPSSPPAFFSLASHTLFHPPRRGTPRRHNRKTNILFRECAHSVQCDLNEKSLHHLSSRFHAFLGAGPYVIKIPTRSFFFISDAKDQGRNVLFCTRRAQRAFHITDSLLHLYEHRRASV